MAVDTSSAAAVSIAVVGPAAAALAAATDEPMPARSPAAAVIASGATIR
ncbi:hypothetical protein VIMS_02376 [Mycobacterium marinum]|nr:hypothetical protein VIMS_02376 [Mycobacterium marinum]RFZ22782.1 hypothetical protein DSM44344_03224 [Mycobacterium marinum]RFZ31368.1 hypothetical protein NCTC2275_03745 [Mycobacterium marinum]